MADQGQWFKLWCSALDDPSLEALSMEDFGRWAKLGALVKKHGTDGELVLRPPARLFCALFHVADFDALMAAFHRLPGVCVRSEILAVSNGTGEDVTFSVSFHNWAKYQGDWSTPRVRSWRARNAEMKRTRGEEKRREERRREVVDAPPQISGGSDVSERKPGKPWPKHQATATRSRKLRIGGQAVGIPPGIRPIVDAWEAGYQKRFKTRPEAPKAWDLSAMLGLVERHGFPEVLDIVEGCMRAGGTKFMRDRERWGLRSIADEWNVLVAMRAKGDLR